MDVLMPDGTTITGVPEGITQSDLLARYGKFAASQPPPKVPDPVNNPALFPQEQFAAAAEAQPAAGIRSLLTGTPMPSEPKAPRPPSEARPFEEIGQGLGMGANIALPSMWEQAGVLKDVGALSTVQQRLDLFNKIENGKITSPDQLFGLDTVNSQGRMYFASGPDMRAKIRDRALSEIGNRKEFVAASLETLDRYQKDSVKYKGRTTDLTDVENVADFTNWLAYNVGSGAVQMAPIMLAAVTTGGVGVGLLGAGMGTAGAVDDRLSFLKDKVKDMPRGQRADAVINYIKETGDTTLAVGIINGMFDVALGPDAALAKRGLKQVLAGETKMQALKAGIKEAPGQMAGEAITGGAQQAVQIAGQIAEKEQDKFLTEKNIKDIINSAAAEAAGSIAGSAATTGARVYGAKGEQLPAPVPPTPPAPPPAVPVAPTAPPAPPSGLTAAPSESMDTDAMLREALGETPKGTVTPANTPEKKTAFDSTGWTQKENTINAKTGEPIFRPGTEVFGKTDERGTHRVVTRNGEISQSSIRSPVIEITNSYLTSDEDNGKITGKIIVDNLTGKLIFAEEGDRGQVLKMSPRAEQQYKDGVPLEKIAETEFSDAGAILPDGTRAPHTTTAAFKTEEAPSQEKLDRSIKESKADIEAANALVANQPAKPAAVEPSEAPADQTKLPGRAISEVPLNKLTLSEDVPQFKADANKAGIVEPLGGTFERTGVAPIQVWRRTDGRLEVISGRHRFDLAKRSGEETIPAQIHDEASGFTRDKAAVLDAELNIRDGQGKVKDYVNYFKGTGLDQKTADTRGLLARAPGKRAFAIANQGSDELVAGVRADQIGDEAAYLIALNAPNDARLQGVAIKAILDGKSAVNAINLMQAVKALAGETDTTLDMFGFDNSAMKEAEAMAKIAAAKQREMQTRLSAISGAAKNPAVAKAEGIDIKDPEAVKRRINELKQLKAAWDSWSTNPDLIAEIRAERGKPAPAPTAREEEVPAAIENEIDQLFGSIEEAEQMVMDNLTPKEQDDELEKARNEQAKDEGAAKEAESESQDLFAEPSETLTSPTPEGLKAQEDRRKAVEAAESKADKEAAAKEKADREAGEFVLTGSDRVADEAAARGQKDIFAEDEESVKNAEKFGYIGKQEEAKPEPVETPEGRNLRYPMAAVLFNDGYEVLALDNPRTYVDKGGEPHRTFEKDGVRVSLTPQLVLFQNKNAVLTGQGESTDLVINALLVDQAKRNQGKANEALQNIVDAADQYGVTLYIEPVPLVNLKEKNFGLDSQQLEDLYKKFGFDFAEDSNKVMVREPEVEVLGPAEKPEAPKLTNEPYTIEGDFTEIGEEKQHLLLTDQTSKLSEDQNKTLESQYGASRNSDKFLDSLRKDVIAFITQGAQAVHGKIRAIIKRIASGVLSVAIVFNPQFVSKPYTIAVPQYDITTSEVVKNLPKEAQSMSDAAKRAYGVIYPALEKQLKEKNKLFIVADKRSGNTYLFNPDGSLLLQSKTLFGKAIGDYMHGDNEIVANRITPAGVFDLGLRDAKRSAGEAYTAGDYDFGKVFVLDKSHMGSNGPYSNTIMHSVWTHETDAKKRLAALEKPGAEDSRYSFGCINVNKETFKYLITNHLDQMDGAKIFIVPENGANVMDFINGKAMSSDDIIRQKIEPVTKTVVTEKKVPAPKRDVERTQTGREEEVKVTAKKETPKTPPEQNFYSLDAYVNEEKSKRSPSLKRKIKQLNKERLDGRLTDEQFIERADEAIRLDEDARLSKDPAERQRGYLLIQEKLSAAARRGEISREAFDLANWFMSQNEDLVSDLGVSIRSSGKDGTGGFYNTLSRVFTLIKNGGSDLTTVHEILHHLERMMPAKVQQAIRKAWASQLAKATKQAKTPAEKLYFTALRDAHYGSNQHSMLNIPEGAGEAYSKVREALEYESGDGSSANFAATMLKLGMVPNSNYEYFNPSEFWAVNGSDIVKARFDAVRGGVLARLKNWLKELGQKIKSIFGMKSDASIIRALDSLAKSDGEFVTKEMLGQGDYQSIRNYQGNAAPTALWSSVAPSFLDGIRYQLEDKNIDLKRVIEAINAATGKIDERLDAYTKETLYHGKTGERTLDFLKKDFRPMFEAMKKEGITVEALEEYLHNRHAEERNEQINKINLSPDVQDIGSGIETSAAKSYLANLPAADRLKLERFADEIDSIIDGTQQILVDGGIETQETIDTWNKTYQYYVPLQRDDLDFVHTGSGYVGGVGTRGSSTKRAVGSIKPVKDILANVLMQRESAIRRTEQAQVGRALYALAITSPNPKFWLPINPNAIKDKAKLVQEMVSLGLTIQDAENLIREPQSPMIDKATGLVRYQVNQSQYNSKNVFPVRINGEDRFIIFNPKDERALRMALSLKNMDADQLGWFLGTMGQVTRWIASINTQYNPVFGAWNMTRDVQSAAFNLSTTEIAGEEKKVLKGTWPAMFAIWNGLRGKPSSSPEQQAYMDLFDQLRLAGGTTGFAQQFSGQRESFDKFVERMKSGAPKEKVTIIEKEMKRLNRGNASKAAHSLFEWLSDYNDAMENAVRLSAFKVALDQGLSVQQAASLAKELTVNFNRKGASSPTLQALYAFINASIQGTSRLIKTLNGPMGKKIIIGGITLGVIQAIALALNGYDDGDPPEFLKDKNFIIPIPFSGKNYIILPMPPGLNVFPGIGRIITEAILIKSGGLKSNKGIGDKVLSIGSLILDSFNPLGAGSITQMLAPTFADPLFAIAANKDAFGRPIYKKDMATESTPGYERSRPTATFISQGLSEFLNWMTSPVGTKHTKGMISPTADEIDYLAGQYFGGLSREIIKGVGSVKAKLEGEEVPANKVPILGKLYGETGTPAAISSRFYDNISQMAEYEHEIKKRIQDKEPTAKFLKDNPSANLWKAANTAEAAINKNNKEKKAYIASGGSSKAGLKEFDDRKVRIMKEFNAQVRATQ